MAATEADRPLARPFHRYREKFRKEPVFLWDAEGGQPPATLTLSELKAVGVPDAERRACWAGQRQTLESLVSVTSAGVVDENGFGVVAKQPLRADQIIIDPTVLLVPRPSDYARAHLPPYDYIAFGANDYALLREVALKHCSLTFYLNGADYAGSRHAPNVKWFVHRHGRGGAQLAWKLLSDVAVGEELLATYTAPEFADPPV